MSPVPKPSEMGQQSYLEESMREIITCDRYEGK